VIWNRLELPDSYFHDDDVYIIKGDCREALQCLSSESIGLILTDPPYGMSELSGRRLHAYRNHEKSKGRIGWANMAQPTDYGDTGWNHHPLDPAVWKLIQEKSVEQIIWGWNHLQSILGKPASILVWDKKKKNDWVDTFSDCEFAYCSRVMPDRLFRFLWMGALREGKRAKRIHPTEKPVELLSWCLSLIPSGVVMDCFLGSGSTLIASYQAGSKCIGIEIEEKYCELATLRYIKYLATREETD